MKKKKNESEESKVNISKQIQNLKAELRSLEPASSKRNKISALKNRLNTKKKDF